MPVPEGMPLVRVLAALGMSLRQIFPASLPTCLQISAQVWLPSLPVALQGCSELSQSSPRAPSPAGCPRLSAPSLPLLVGVTVKNDTTRAVSTVKMLSLSSSASCNRLGETQGISDSGNIP